MAELPSKAHSRAILIGTSDYQHRGLPALPAVRNNLIDLSRALTDERTGILGWEQCVIVDTPDSPATFVERLRRVANQAGDLLIVYYAGHGLRHDTRDELYLTVRQTDPDGLTGTAVPFEWVREVIADSPAEAKLLVLDCCYSGTALGAMSGGITTRDITVAGTSVITSSPANQISHSPVGARHTAFSGVLISLLTNGPLVPGKPLTVQTLYRSLTVALTAEGLPRPKFKSTDTSAELLLRRCPEPPRQEPAPPRPAAPQPMVDPVHDARSGAPSQGAMEQADPTPQADPWPSRGNTPADTSQAGAREAAQAAGAPAAKAVRRSAVVALWITLMLAVPSMIGGFTGFLLGEPPPGGTSSDDLVIGVVFLWVTVVCLSIVRWGLAKRRLGRAPTGFVEAVTAVLMAPLRRVPTWVFASLLPSSAMLIAVGLTTDLKSTATTTTGTTSDLAATTSTVGVFCLAGLIAAAELVRRKKAGARPDNRE